MNEDLELSIIMPCLNEELTLPICIKKAKSFLEMYKINGEVIISDNGSTDKSVEIAINEGARVVHASQKGYGSAIINGIEASKAKFCIIGDADDSYDFLGLEPFLNELRNGADLVMGNRFKGGVEQGAMPFLHKYLGNPVLSFIGRLFFRCNIGDFHCGLRGISKRAYDQLNLVTTGMEFASEMIVKSVLKKLKIVEVPTTLSKDGRDRKPHLNTWVDGWRHLVFLLLYSPKWLFFIPGIVFFFIGILGTLVLSFDSIKFSSITFDVHTLLYINTAIIIGVQFILFYLFSRIYGVINGLLPKTSLYEKWSKYIQLEKGLVIGVLLVFFGIVSTFLSLKYWADNDFGNLMPKVFLRRVIPAVTALISGFEIISFSFLISFIKIPRVFQKDN